VRPPSDETIARWRSLLLGLIAPSIGIALIVWMVATKTATKESVGSAGLLILCFVAKRPPTDGDGSSPGAAPPSGTPPPAASG
jgi:hypothetical protein